MSASAPITQRILREPLFHFLLLAVLLFLLDNAFSSLQKETIVVDRQAAQYLVQVREDLEMRKLTAAERRETIDNYIADEILYTEAYNRGLDKGDSRMRRNMILKMRGLLSDEVGEPSEEQLRDYFEANRAAYIYPARWSLDHVFFADPSQVSEGLLDRLNSGLDAGALGEFRPGMGRRLPDRSKSELMGLFGPEASSTILEIQDAQWHGPLESPLGVHFARVTGHEPERDADFEHIRDYLERDWALSQVGRAVEQAVERLRDNFEIVIEDDAG